MVGAGFLLLAFALLAAFLALSEMLESKNRWLRVFPFLIVLPYIATTTGWLMTEVGRMPWIVYGLMRVEQGVSTTTTVLSVALTLVGFTLIYALLMAATIYLLMKFARAGGAPQTNASQETGAFVLQPAD
jgi:cytochrome d ubiquinol oxidase subunit I